ncbi:DUF262 and DUF1524 domain-containing protein [Deinococcus ficus]|uniref:DUF262 and DUF1524 domain-containing protein n=1 Tax=Deinococcus ficus TaxID=317577 RepID=UPI000A021657|nr:DUF262 and DUF1524 domain-containing protein [Deinococcus ficus]
MLGGAALVAALRHQRGFSIVIAKESKLLRFLQGEKQFYVPIYQRTYSWLRPQCEQYWHDLLTAGTATEVDAHFLGAVVSIGRGVSQASDVAQMLVIDGQQRLTTTTLLLLALVRRLGDSGEIVLSTEQEDGTVTESRITAARLRENYLINKHEEGQEGYFKLLLTQADRDTLQRLLDGRPQQGQASPRIVENLKFFEDKLADLALDLQDVYRGLQKLLIVDVALEQGKDNPQLIFESMNSTGLDLSQADLIRNYVLMGLSPKAQTRLYLDYWKPMEDRFAGREPQDFDKFVRDFLSLRAPANTPSRLDRVYAEFKRYAATQPESGGLVQDLSRMSRFYAAILEPLTHEPDLEVRQAILDLSALKLDVVNPFLMQVYSDWQEGRLSKGDFLQVLRLTESYLYRRSICGINSQGLNKLFPDLPRRIDPINYVQSFQDALYDLKTYLRFPRDPEFREGLAHRDLYQVKRLSGYTLLKLENHHHKERISLGGLTIEHILPQAENLHPDWRAMLGAHAAEVQGRYLHTLGNLTLTGYNSELSARPFQEKRDLVPGGFKDSHLRLNADLAQLDIWNEEQIKRRAEKLADQALQVWPMLEPSAEAAARVDDRTRRTVSERTVEDHLKGVSTELRELFEDLRERLLNLHEDVTERPLAAYIGYKVGTNFCDMLPQPSLNAVKCWLNLPYPALDDPTGRARDISQIGHYGNGDVEVTVRPGDDLEWFFHLAEQALRHQLARSTSDAETAMEAHLAAHPELRQIAEELERRFAQLSSTIAIKRNKRSITWRGRKGLVELYRFRRTRGLVAYVNVGEAGEAIPGSDRVHWEATRWPSYQRRFLHTLSDVDAIWPTVEGVFQRDQHA